MIKKQQEKEEKKGDEISIWPDFHTPVAQTIETWLAQIERHGFHPTVLAAFAKDTIDTETEDDTWFQENVVRVFDPYYDLESDEVKQVDGKIDPRTGLPSGPCTVQLHNGDELLGTFRSGLRQGRGSIEGDNLNRHGLVCVRGHYIDGLLMGQGRAVLKEGAMWPQIKARVSLEGVFNEGYLEGPVRGLDDHGNLIFVGRYAKGLPVGPCWLSKEGQGWLYGQVDPGGRFSGSNLAYLYPDLQTCLVGHFEDEVMIAANPGCITTASLDEAGIMTLALQRSNPKVDSSFSFCPSDSKSIRCDRLLPDPYEEVTVKCEASHVNGAGEGLFAKR